MNRYLTTKQVCRILEISRPTVYKLIRKGILHPKEKPEYLERQAFLLFPEKEVMDLANKPLPEENEPLLAGVA